MASNAVAAGEGFGLRPPTEKSLMLFMATAGSAPLKNARHRRPHGDRLEWRFLRRLRQVVQRAVEPSIFGGLHAGSAGLHEILRIEVRAAGVGRSGGVHNRQLTLLPQRLERRERRMQPEEAIEIEHRLARNVDARPHGVILRLARKAPQCSVRPPRRAGRSRPGACSRTPARPRPWRREQESSAPPPCRRRQARCCEEKRDV